MANDIEERIETDEPAPSAKSGSEPGLGIALWKWLSSMKTAIVLLLLLAVASVLGTLIPQGGGREMDSQVFYHLQYGFYRKIGLTDVYHSGWYNALLALIAASLLVCSINRFGIAWRRTFHPRVGTSSGQVNAMGCARKVDSRLDSETATAAVVTALRSASYRVLREDKEGSVSLCASKGRSSIWGPYLTHLAILVVFLGGIMTARLSIEGFTAIADGEQTSSYHIGDSERATDLGFQLKLNKFTVERDSMGNPTAYKSYVDVIDGGKMIMRAVIDVNHPLTYKGLSVFQSTYGPLLRLRVTSSGGESRIVDLDLKMNELPQGIDYQLSDLEPHTMQFGRDKLSVFVHEFSQNFSGLVSAGSDMLPPDPAVRVYANEHFPEDKDIRNWKSLDWITTGSPVAYKGYTIALVGVVYYTGLQVSSNPALPVIYMGFILLLLGIFMSFYIRYRVIRVSISPMGDGSSVAMGGACKVDNSIFDRDFKRIAEALQ